MDKELDKNWAIWWTLERFYGFRNAGHTEFNIQIHILRSQPDQPHHELQIQALNELQKSNALIVTRTNDDSTERGKYIKEYKVVPHDPEFTEWYERYKQAMELPADLFRYLPTGKDLNDDLPLVIKEKLKDEYVIFYNQKGLEFFQGLARYTRNLTQSKVVREFLDKHLIPDHPIKYWPGDSYGTVDVVVLFYLVYLANYGKIPNRKDLTFLGFNLYSAAWQEVAQYNEPHKHALLFKISEDNFRRYLRHFHNDLTAELDKSITQSQKEQPVVELPENPEWKHLKLAFTAPAEIEVSYKGKRIGKYTAESLGFKGRQKFGVDRQWELLRLLSIAQNNATFRPERKEIAKTAGWKLDNLDKIKEQLEEKLHKVFGLPDSSPFKNTKQLKYYETEFALLPEQILRRDEDPDTDTYAYDDSRLYGEVNDD
jgi:hypothetical protein